MGLTASTQRAALQMLATAAVMAVLADLLFNGVSIGVNLVIWQSALILGVTFCSVSAGRRIGFSRRALLVCSLGFAALTAVRAAPWLQALDVAMAALFLLLGLALPRASRLRQIGPLPLTLALIGGVVSLVAAALCCVKVIRWTDALAGRARDDALIIGRALLVSVPVLVVFGGLFIAADAVFESKARSLVDIGGDDLISHVLYLSAGFWVSMAAIWSGVAIEVPEDALADLPDERRPGAVELVILLLPLAMLFLGFVLVQIQYLFGGRETVQDSLHLTYSEYARRGFFELVAVSSLLLPLLLIVKWARRSDRRSAGAFTLLALVLVLLLAVVMASAWQRLGIYIDALGLTQLRFYVAATLVWLMVAFGWFLVCLFRPVGGLFLRGVAVAAVVVLVGLNLVNPDALIARTNTSRLEHGRSFDVEHASSLSADAVPVLVDRLDSLPERDRCLLAQRLLKQWGDSDDGIRSFNLGRSAARSSIEANRTQLEQACP